MRLMSPMHTQSECAAIAHLLWSLVSFHEYPQAAIVRTLMLFQRYVGAQNDAIWGRGEGMKCTKERRLEAQTAGRYALGKRGWKTKTRQEV